MAIKIDTYTNSILKNVKHYPDEPVYLISVSGPDIYYETKINDIIIKQSYTNNEGSFPIKLFSNVNNVFNQDGKQKVSFTLYPAVNKTFQNNDWVEISIESRNQFGDDKTIFTFEPPMKDDGETSEHIGLESYSGEFEFEASIPYEKQINWVDSENLQNRKNIEKEVVEAYKEVMRLYAEGDLDNLLELYKPIFQDEAQSVYATKEKKTRLYKLNWERLHPFFYKSKPNLVKDYELKFYADGKLVTLEKKKDSSRAYNESALSIIYDKDFDKFPDGLSRKNRDVVMFNEGTTPKMEMELFLLFHKPRGSKTLKLATDIFRKEKLLNGKD
ncbi:TraB/GumN family protein [Aquimarina sp. I32.4]|uniref:TraB/GumN family protein n=1 Tax=Aquimarina sp. I32.4 TaxID=2053903 RepID=UPI0011AFB696|nr:TraB/GumN family protein [Aquimarina sp. I32.4]